jgi:hypothetical protein
MMTPKEKMRRAAGNGGLSDVGMEKAPKMHAQCSIIVPLAAGENRRTEIELSPGSSIRMAVRPVSA